MIVITGSIDLPDLDREEVEAALVELTTLGRQEAGCIDYWWAEDVLRPIRFRFFECWESDQHMSEHRAQPFEDEFMARFVARASGARAHLYAVSDRRVAT